MEEARRMPLRGHINADLSPKKSAYFSRTEPTRTWWSSLGCVVLMGTLRHFLSQLCLETRGPWLCLPSCEMGWMAVPFQCEAESQTSCEECKVVGSRKGRVERLLTDACRFPSPEEMSSSNRSSLISGLLLESFFLHQWNRKQGLGEGWFWLEDTACNPFWMFTKYVYQAACSPKPSNRLKQESCWFVACFLFFPFFFFKSSQMLDLETLFLFKNNLSRGQSI